MSHSDDTIIEVRDLVKRYGSFTAVNGISLAVRRGEIFGILGPNGAGKTTTLEMIEGLRVPDGGSITVDGLDAVRNSEEVRRIIGVQLQSTALFPYLGSAEMIELFAGLYDVPSDENRINQLLDMVNLREKSGAQVAELSGGQQQRLSITLALVNNPKIVFLDEPTTGLDPAARRDLWQVIQTIRDAGTTIVLTTHYMEEAEVLCDRVAIMDHGEVIAFDTPGALVAALGIEAVVKARFAGGSLTESDLDQLPDVLGVTVRAEQLEIRTRNVQSTLIALLDLVKAEGVTLSELTSQQSTLEDVFLSLTGRAIEHDEEEKPPEGESVATGRRRRFGRS